MCENAKLLGNEEYSMTTRKILGQIEKKKKFGTIFLRGIPLKDNQLFHNGVSEIRKHHSWLLNSANKILLSHLSRFHTNL